MYEFEVVVDWVIEDEYEDIRNVFYLEECIVFYLGEERVSVVFLEERYIVMLQLGERLIDYWVFDNVTDVLETLEQIAFNDKGCKGENYEEANQF